MADDVAGRAVKAALCYFDSHEDPSLDPVARVVFDVLKSNVDEADRDYKARSDRNTQNINSRWGKTAAPTGTTGTTGTTGIHSLRLDTEQEVEVDYTSTSIKANTTAAPSVETGGPPSESDVYYDEETREFRKRVRQ